MKLWRLFASGFLACRCLVAQGSEPNGAGYSPLARIDISNVDKLGFVWQFKTGTYRGLDATPLFVGGVLYFPGIWGSVHALDAVTGKELWRFTPRLSW